MNDTFMKERPVFPLILSMAMPMVISMLVNSLYNIVDSFFVAQISEDAMTALSLVFPVQNFSNAIAIGFGIGISSQIAICLGAGNKETASKAATHGLALSALHGILLTVICISIMPKFLSVFTSDKNVSSLGVRYSTIVFLFAIVTTINLAYEKIFQGVGNMKVTMIGLMVGCVSNILLDPLMIFGLGPFPAMGIEGAALATGLGQVLNLVFYLIVYKMRPIQVQISRRYLHPDKSLASRLYSVGIPGALNLALPSVLVSALNGLLAAYSQSYVVILGIYYKLQTFLYLPASGIVQGMRPVIGYNYGAGEHKRVKKIYFVTLCMSGVIMLIGTIICLTVPGQLIGMFTTNCCRQNCPSDHLRRFSCFFCICYILWRPGGAWTRQCFAGCLSLQISDHHSAGRVYLKSFLRGCWCVECILDCRSFDRRGVIYDQSEGYRNRGVAPKPPVEGVSLSAVYLFSCSC